MHTYFISFLAEAIYIRGGYWTAAKSKMKLFVVIGNGWKPSTIITSAPSWMLQQS